MQLFVANGYCEFEDNVCVDILGVIDGKPNYDVPLLKLFARPCVDRPEVLDERPDYVTALLSEFFARARCPLVLALFGVTSVKVYG